MDPSGGVGPPNPEWWDELVRSSVHLFLSNIPGYATYMLRGESREKGQKPRFSETPDLIEISRNPRRNLRSNPRSQEGPGEHTQLPVLQQLLPDESYYTMITITTYILNIRYIMWAIWPYGHGQSMEQRSRGCSLLWHSAPPKMAVGLL